MGDLVYALALVGFGAAGGGFVCWSVMARRVDSMARSLAAGAIRGAQTFREATEAPPEGRSVGEDAPAVVRPLRAVQGQH